MADNPDLLERIESSLGGFSKSRRAIGRYILDHYDKAAYMTAARLGASVGVSESTVVRFAIGLGFVGYPELQHELREHIRVRLTALQRIEVTNERMGSDIVQSVLRNDILRIKETMEKVSREAFNGAVDAILASKAVYIIGLRTASVLVSFLGCNLNLLCDNVRLLQAVSGGEMFEQLLRVGKGDVVFAISFPRYSKRVVNAVDFAKDAGAQVIALTDCADSPIARRADWLLTAQSDMASFCDSLVGPLSLINALLTAIAQKRKAECSDIFDRLENIWQKYDVYTRSSDITGGENA